MIEKFPVQESAGAQSSKRRSALDRFEVFSDVTIEVRDKFGNLKSRSVQHNLRTTVGIDFWDFALFAISKTLTGTNTISSVAAASGTGGPAGTATTVYTGTFTNGGSNAYAGYLITLTGGSSAANNGTYLCLASTTTTLTLANPNGVAQSSGTEPTVQTAVTNGGQANWIALTTDATAPAAGDTTLASELSTNGLSRAQAADAHTGGATSSVLSHTWTFTGSSSTVIAKAGLFNSSSGGSMVLETLLSSTATVSANGDTVTVSWTINF